MASERFIGIDVGAETIKLVELQRNGAGWTCSRRDRVEHHKEPGHTLTALLASWEWSRTSGAAVTGRLSRMVAVPRIPVKQARGEGFRFLHGDQPATVVSIGSHGFSVLELRGPNLEVLRENARCSQGTGNFLRQLVERFNIGIEEASALCETEDDPAPLSGRCPVILKTDMTHLANQGEDRGRILAGLFDAVCENVQALIKPGLSPPLLFLIGGVSRSGRIRENFRAYAAAHHMGFLTGDRADADFVDAIGCAVMASRGRDRMVPALGDLVQPLEHTPLERLPGLSGFAARVKRLPPSPVSDAAAGIRAVLLGFDMGSTGSKAVAVDVDTTEVLWEGYTRTGGNPVAAAQWLMERFRESPAAGQSLMAFGVTGSGREIVGSLLSSAYGVDRVYVLNEIAAHAEGALYFDPRVDTIFEIGGQDAKYIRLAGGRVVDAAMNEACSAGTGSFIEEQGRKFAGIRDVVHLGEEALGAGAGVSLGQHCSVFMAEVIDGAVAAGVENRAIIAGIYDSIIQNYLHRVKGSRSVGDVIFCQGMPFASDALAAAVVRQTDSEVVIPPNPGTVGALGISLLTRKAIELEVFEEGVDPQRFLDAEVLAKDTFRCKANRGCGGAGNKCRVDRIKVCVAGKKNAFTWGGGCSLWDRGTGKKKLPDRSPDPFRLRENQVDELIAHLSSPRGGPRVAITDAFQLKGLFPFFTTFLHRLGLDLEISRGASRAWLTRGIDRANVPFCAPMQHYHGLVSDLADAEADFLFLPMLRSLVPAKGEPHAVLCPIVQASSDLIASDLGGKVNGRIVSPVMDLGEGLDSPLFAESCRRVAAAFGVKGRAWRSAFDEARRAQQAFDAACLDIGRAALAFAAEQGLTPVVVLGRPYTIYNKVLNSNVPALLREQGALAIPVDCYPVSDDVPVFDRMYWGYGQRNLRAAHQIRRTPGTYSVWCSNYSCGPDSFSIHFYAYILEGKPFSLIETDGHAGDAGTKTRIEAFLHCVREDLAESEARDRILRDFGPVAASAERLHDLVARGSTILVPPMGGTVEVLVYLLRGLGIDAERLPTPDRETIRMGRRFTSGKECVPMTLTVGSLLQRLEREPDPDRRFAFLMPSAHGPCRLGVYHLLHQLILERKAWSDRVSVWSPPSSDYFRDLPPGSSALVLAGSAALDMLLAGLYDTRPVETQPGAAEVIFARHRQAILDRIQREAPRLKSTTRALGTVAAGGLFGCSSLLRRAAESFAAVKSDDRLPTVLLVGEIYVRCDPAANDDLVRQLEARGMAVRFAPFIEWLEYVDVINRSLPGGRSLGARVSGLAQRRILETAYGALAEPLGWPPRTTVSDTLAAAAPWVREDLRGEAVLTVGGPVHEWREGLIDAAVNVGPLECMPSKIAESQFHHIAEQEGLLCLTIPVNGDSIDSEILDNFAFEVHQRFRAKAAAAGRG